MALKMTPMIRIWSQPSSAVFHPKICGSSRAALFEEMNGQEPPPSLIPPLLATAVGHSDEDTLKQAMRFFAIKYNEQPKAWQINAVTNLIESLSQRAKSSVKDPDARKMISDMQEMARSIAVSDSDDEDIATLPRFTCSAGNRGVLNEILNTFVRFYPA